MKRQHELQRQLRSVIALKDAVSAMKSLSAHHLRESRVALPAAREYRAGIDALVERIGAWLPAGSGSAGLLVVGGELGLCGSYNREVARAARARRTRLGSGPTLCVGRRLQRILDQQGLELDESYSAPTNPEGITPLLSTLAQDILTAFCTRNLSRFEIVATRFEGVGNHRPVVTTLLPIEHEAPRDAPSNRYASPETVREVAVRELLYITIHDLLLDALASEHAARLSATAAAEDWLKRRAQSIRQTLTAARREASTQEVIEIAAGARARHRQASRARGEQG